MKDLKNRKHLFAVLMLLAVFAGCKGEDPTAPPPSSGPGTGTGTPPVGASVTLTVANPNPLANSSTTITATVTSGGQPVPNGTAVEFGTTFGVFTDTGSNGTIKTTTNGVATATLTATAAGIANVTAVVNNVVARTTITFQAVTTGPPPTDATPAITAISPTSGRPDGGETITLTGRNFRGPVRVFFDVGGGRLVEGAVVSQTSTQVQVLTPRIDLGTGQTLSSAVILINEAGTPSEVRIQAGTTFTFRRATITPTVVTVSPDSGPINGGTRITIFGDGFEAPVQVSFSPGNTSGADGWHQLEVINVTFNQIIAITPPGRDVIPIGSGTLTGPVDLRVLNINSGTNAVASVAFRYLAAIQITGVRPLQGTALGGTDVTIDGIGFVAPVDVFIGGVMAQPIRVSGTQILARTSALASPCAGGAGAISVVNINNGDTASAVSPFLYIPVQPLITGVTAGGAITPGTSITVNVQDPGVGPLGTGLPRFTINGVNVAPTPNQITSGTGIQPFTMVVPITGFNFPTITCTTGAATPGTQLGPLNVSIVFTNATTGCTNTLENGLTVNPPGPNTCLSSPTPVVTPGPPPVCATAPPASSTGAGGLPTSSTTTLTVTNAPGSAPLNITGVAVSGTNAAEFTVTPPTASNIPGGGSQVFTVTFTPGVVAAPTARNVTVTFTTNSTTTATVTGCVTGQANP